MDDSYYTSGTWYESNGVLKRAYTYFFSSSHERGLEELLSIWGDIKKEIPEAVLHVGYGTYTASQIMKQRKDWDALDELRGLEQLMYETEGVVYHGRMNQWELARVQMECEAWLYPYQHEPKWAGLGGFLETYCITALEAQAAKAIPICRLNGALPEVVKNGVEWRANTTTQEIITILKQIHDADGDHWVPNGAVDDPASTPQTKRTAIRQDVERMIEENYEWAMSQSWESLAVEWLKHFAKVKTAREETNG